MEEMGQLTMPVSITRVEAHHADGTRATSWSVVQVSAFDGDDGETTSSDRDVDDEPQQNMQLAVAQPLSRSRRRTNRRIWSTKFILIYTPYKNGRVFTSTLRMWTEEPETMNYPFLILTAPRLEQQMRLQNRIQWAPLRAERNSTILRARLANIHRLYHSPEILCRF